MAIQQQIGTSEDWFIGEDKTLSFEVYDSTGVTMQDVTGWAIQWVLRKMLDDDAIQLNKATGGSGISITGTYNSDRATNTQRVVVTVADTDTDNMQPGLYHHALKRTTDTAETVLSYGTVHLKKAAL